MLRIVRNARVYAPEPLGIRQVVVAAGTILWIGEEDPGVPASLVSDDLDARGRRLIPGLIDGHVHLTGGGGEDGFASRVPPLALSRLTRAGVTSIVALTGTDDVTRTTAGLLAEVRGLVALGFDAWCYTGGYRIPPITLTGSVREDIVHIDRIIGAGELALSDHRSSQPTLAELLRVASDVHVAGLLTGKAGSVHLHLGDGDRGLDLVRQALRDSELPARTFHPTHVNRRRPLFDEALDLARRGMTIDITAFPVAEKEDAWSAEEAVSRALDAGIDSASLTVSSDCGGSLPIFDEAGRVIRMGVGQPALAATLAALVREGRALEDVLPPFTTSVARQLRLGRKGRVAMGSDADLVILDDEGGVTDVMVLGAWHVRDGRPVVRGRFEGDRT